MVPKVICAGERVPGFIYRSNFEGSGLPCILSSLMDTIIVDLSVDSGFFLGHSADMHYAEPET